MRRPGGATGMPAAPGGRLRAVSNRDAPPPSVRNAPPTHNRNELLAALAAVYARVLGQSVPSRDIAETLARLSDAPTPVALAQALQEAGLLSEVQHDMACQPDAWPALARMTNGQTILVLEQGDAGLVIYDRTCPDNRATVPLADFAPFFSGETIRAEIPLGQLSGVHGAQGAEAHWFWGEFAGFRRAFGEVVLGSFVANLLAVAVALFALQVYDRVIPHQSQATLWVLAGGAGLALLMEAALKLARAAYGWRGPANRTQRADPADEPCAWHALGTGRARAKPAFQCDARIRLGARILHLGHHRQPCRCAIHLRLSAARGADRGQCRVAAYPGRGADGAARYLPATPHGCPDAKRAGRIRQGVAPAS